MSVTDRQADRQRTSKFFVPHQDPTTDIVLTERQSAVSEVRYWMSKMFTNKTAK